EYAAKFLNNAPTLIGEIGIAFDLNHRRAYHNGDYRQQVQALNRSLRAVEENLLSYALWNYTSDNDNAHGDQWNGEDLSIYSCDQCSRPDDPYSGGRALQAVIRPYPRAVAGEPLRLSFDPNKKIFQFEFRHQPNIQAPTELFIPDYQYPDGYNIWLSDGECELRKEDQVLYYEHNPERKTHRIRVTPR
ncbi:MAG: glycosyl hydrolase family 35, partial [Anaerolineaceae bacterium]|nr:glycosyl hydrolase family 35 [Anaerolineaceae bacterium]